MKYLDKAEQTFRSLGGSARRKETNCQASAFAGTVDREILRSIDLVEPIAQRSSPKKIGSPRCHPDNRGWDRPEVDVVHRVGSR